MPIAVEWIVRDRVILSSLSGKVTKTEFESWLESQQYMVEMGDPKVHHISDSRRLERLNVDLQDFQQIIRALPRNPNFGWHIEVTDHPLNKMTASIVAHFADVNMRTYPALSQAITFLKDNDETLRDARWRTPQPAYNAL